MAPFASPSFLKDATAGKPLFESMRDHYLSTPEVRDWLFQRDNRTVPNGGLLDMAFSYACMYYPPPFVPKGEAPYPLPKPFLDLGDFLVCQRLHNGIALGTLFNQNENHALSAVRDSMLSSPKLSSRPRARNFAVDLRVKHLEILEFAWMDDDSLIVACRRLQPSPHAPDSSTVLSADLIFFPVLHPLDTLSDPPLLRMTLSEKAATCQFCGVTGVKACKCPPSFKIRAASSPYSTLPVFPVLPSSSSNASIYADVDEESYVQQDPAVLRMALHSWPRYARNMFKLNEVGAFFCSWFVRSPDGTSLVPSYTHRHPVPYQFVTGNKNDTLMLASVYVKRLSMAQRTMCADLRLLTPPPASESMISTTTLPSAQSTSENGCSHSKKITNLSPSTPPLSEPEHLLIDEGEDNVDPVKPPTPPNRMRAKMSDAAEHAKKERLKQFMAENVLNNRKCIPCNKTFSKRSNLVRHIETGHFALRPFQCQACPKRFGHSNHLRRHIEKLHTQAERLHT